MSAPAVDPGRARLLRSVFITLLALIAVPLVAMSILSILRMKHIWMGDYRSYAAAAERWLQGAPIYADFQLDGPYLLGLAAWGNGFVYPPLAALSAVPFAVLGRDLGFLLFTIASAIALGGVAFLIARRQGLGARAAAVLGVAILLTAPVLESLGTGQANTALAALFGATWVWRRTAGYAAVLGGLVKVFPLVGLAWAYRCRAPILVPLLAGAAVVVLSVQVFGVQGWIDFGVALGNGRGSAYWFPEPPRHWIEPIMGTMWAALISYATAAGIALLALRVRDDRTAFLLVAVAMITPAPDWFVHYFTVPLIGAMPWIASLAAGWPRMWASLGSPQAAT